MHNDVVRPSVWVPELVPNQADYQRWDAKQSNGIDADDGGTWSPKTPIILGGAGGALTTAGSSITGGVSTKQGGRLIFQTSGSVGFPLLSPSRVRTLEIPIIGANVHTDILLGTGSQLEDDYVTPVLGPALYGVRLQNTVNQLSIDFPERFAHQGARFATVGLTFALNTRPQALPSSFMQVQISGTSNASVAQAFIPAGASPGFGGFALWTAGHTYAAGAFVIPTATNSNGLYFRATIGGHSNVVEPTWPSTIGATVVDGGVVWTATGRSGNYPTKGVSLDSYYNNGRPQTIAVDLYGAAIGNFGDGATVYQLRVSNVDSTAVLTGAFVSYDTINTLQFE
jgi:hypothetical protein